MAENIRAQDSNKDRSSEQSRPNDHIRENVGHQKGSTDRSDASNLNEKSSTIGRRDKSSGLASKDGLTGSDYDGQLTD